MGFPGGSSGKELACQHRTHKRCRFILLVRKILWKRAWQPTPVFLPEESPWTEELGGLQSMESKRVRHDWETVYIYIHVCMLSCVCVYICNGSYKKNEIMPFTATWIQLEIIILSEVSQKEKDKYHTNHLYVESKIWSKWTYLWNRNRIMDTENRLVIAEGEGFERGMEWEVGISRYKLLCTEWIK